MEGGGNRSVISVVMGGDISHRIGGRGKAVEAVVGEKSGWTGDSGTERGAADERATRIVIVNRGDGSGDRRVPGIPLDAAVEQSALVIGECAGEIRGLGPADGGRAQAYELAGIVVGEIADFEVFNPQRAWVQGGRAINRPFLQCHADNPAPLVADEETGIGGVRRIWRSVRTEMAGVATKDPAAIVDCEIRGDSIGWSSTRAV